MIGLRRGDVKLFEHNKEWKIEGERTVNELRKILGSDAVDIQHVGSTSIKSIKAKPIRYCSRHRRFQSHFIS